jgi:hypothetical protein
MQSSGSRTVFDEEGNSVDPLALLASYELGKEGGLAGQEAEVDEGVYVVKDQSTERFQVAANILKE